MIACHEGQVLHGNGYALYSAERPRTGRDDRTHRKRRFDIDRDGKVVALTIEHGIETSAEQIL